MMEIFTPENERAIQQLRNRMRDELPQEMYDDKVLLYKFLKARNFNLKQSEYMLRKNLDYRKYLQIDRIIKDFKPSEVLQKYVSESYIGCDKEGSPVRYSALGAVDGKGLFKSSNSFDLLRCVMQQIEMDLITHKQQSRKTGRNIFQSTFIFNMDEFSLLKATHKQSIQNFMEGTTIFQDNYPEILKRLYIINAQKYFTIAFRVIEKILAPALRDKIRVYGLSGWKEDLLKAIDEDVLPAFLGGKRTDPDGNPLCLTFVNHAGMVPESYYLVKDIERTASKPGMKYIRVERQSRTSIPIKIDIPMSILNWEFETKYYDIGFILTLEVSNEENCKKIIMPFFKLRTELEPHYGMYRCKEIGKYNIVFDNSYSWLHHKDVYYRTWVTDGKDS